LQVSIGVFSGAVEKFSGEDGSAPLEKICPYAYGQLTGRTITLAARKLEKPAAIG